ncbi:hypothetical protein G5C51_21895 [Streptomyces sp. A7024]|uniref:Uncharacterized protein n=1 Tax=Streptomyces coryli TaxID=1128680 RepID=A0A6G4U5R3_9ACTN|nr:hypothetical protein [Streptomyces coryli]NGN66541.1 hypothetical protein [Streptomyces coryli]
MNALIAVMQLLVAAAFVSIPTVRHRYGPTATAAAEAELTRQGVRTSVLAENKMRFDAGGHETAAPATVAAIMVMLAVLNLADAGPAHVLTWVFQSLVLLANVVIVHSMLTATKSVQAAFARKGDPELARIDVPALLKAAEDGFPKWTWTLATVRNVTVFGACGVVLLAPALG